LQTQLIIANSLGFGAKGTHELTEKLSADVSRMLIALMKSLKQ
jgi:hypothetical protein